MKSALNGIGLPFLLVIGFVVIAKLSYSHFGSKGPFGGTISCVAINDTSAVYFGTPDGGVYESTTTALTAWRARPVGLKSGKITALTHTGSYLFAATADSGVFIFNGYSGSDRYWIKVNNGLTNLHVESLVAIDSVTVLAGTAGGGVFKTVDKGETWFHINSVALNTAVISGFVNTGDRILLLSLSGGVFKSDDDGNSWSDFNDVNTLNVLGTRTISYNVLTDEALIVNNNGIFVVADATTSNDPVYTLSQSGLPAFANVHSVTNNGSDWFVAADIGVFVSSATMIQWAPVNAGLNTQDITAIIVFRDGLVCGTNESGIFKSSVEPISWIQINGGFNNLTTHSMITHGETLVIAATEMGVHVSKDLANSYTLSNQGLTDSLHVTDLTFFNTMLFATTEFAGVFVSLDTGATWATYNNGLTNLNVRRIFSSDMDLYIFDSNGHILKSNVPGSWTTMQEGLPVQVEPTSLAFTDSGMLLGTNGMGIYFRAEDEQSWNAVNNGLDNLNVTAVTASADKLFAGTDGDGVFVSDAGVFNWAAASVTSIAHTELMDLDGSRIQAMGTYTGYVFASYKGGLLATSDNGETWIAAGNQFNLPSFTDVQKISFVTTRVFVTTQNNGLYSNALSELPVIITGVASMDNDSRAFNIYPNPNNGSFNLQLTNGVDTWQEVMIYDNTGQLVERKSLSPGISNYTINGRSGVYYVRIRTEKGVFASEIVVY